MIHDESIDCFSMLQIAQSERTVQANSILKYESKYVYHHFCNRTNYTINKYGIFFMVWIQGQLNLNETIGSTR